MQVVLLRFANLFSPAFCGDSAPWSTVRRRRKKCSSFGIHDNDCAALPCDSRFLLLILLLTHFLCALTHNSFRFLLCSRYRLSLTWLTVRSLEAALFFVPRIAVCFTHFFASDAGPSGRFYHKVVCRASNYFDRHIFELFEHNNDFRAFDTFLRHALHRSTP